MISIYYYMKYIKEQEKIKHTPITRPIHIIKLSQKAH